MKIFKAKFIFKFVFRQKFRFFWRYYILIVASISFSFCQMTRPSDFLNRWLLLHLYRLVAPPIPKNAFRLTPRMSPAAPPMSEKNCVDSYSICSTWSDLCSGWNKKEIVGYTTTINSHFQKYHNACQHFGIVLLIVVNFVLSVAS